MKKLIAIVGVVFALGMTTPAYGAAEDVTHQQSRISNAIAGEHISSYGVTIHITKDNKAHITENIRYDFGSERRHGIFRDIPIDLIDGKNRYYMQLDNDSVRNGGGAYIESARGEVRGGDGATNVRLRIGNPDEYVTGMNTYRISYILHPILLKKNGKPFLNLDVIGTGWTVPIQNASAKITSEGDATFDDVACFVGKQGETSQERCRVDGNAFSAEDLSPSEGMTINATLKKGFVSTYLEPNKPRPINWVNVFFVAAAGVLPAGAIVAAFVIYGVRRRRVKKRRKQQIVVAQYDPPAMLTPAEIGLLEDDSSNMQEVTATIIQWAVRGFITVSYNAETKDVSLEKTTLAPQDVANYELGLYTALFEKGSFITLNQYESSTIVNAIGEFKKGVSDSLTQKGYYASEGGVFEKGNLTNEGAKVWALVDGFRLFIDVVEKDRLAFSDAPQKTPERFNILLPYAIALGIEKEWTKQFDGIDLTPTINQWYRGSDTAMFNAGLLAGSLSRGLSAVSVMPSTASSSNSGFSSSGGSSGGGAGGGGGGSW